MLDVVYARWQERSQPSRVERKVDQRVTGVAVPNTHIER